MRSGLGKTLHNLRIRNGLSLPEAATLAHLTETEYAQAEKIPERVGLNRLSAMLGALTTDENDLIELATHILSPKVRAAAHPKS